MQNANISNIQYPSIGLKFCSFFTKHSFEFIRNLLKIAEQTDSIWSITGRKMMSMHITNRKLISIRKKKPNAYRRVSTVKLPETLHSHFSNSNRMTHGNRHCAFNYSMFYHITFDLSFIPSNARLIEIFNHPN